MRPLQVTIAAWGSYKDKVTVDFTRFEQGSLFLITGPTGAGKTTIFDAISFALFGDVSGKTREKGSLRSDFASSTEDTYVELRFEHKGHNYRVFRAPKYERAKKRGEGTTTSPEVAELYIEDQPPIVVINEVNRKVEEILGLTYNQFKQISMIAQGEFLELLVASSKDRVEILRNIFKTNQYEKLQKALTEKSLQLAKELTEQGNRLEEIVNSAILQSEDEEILQPPYNYDAILQRLKESITEAKKSEKDINERIHECEIIEKRAVEQITKGEKILEDQRRLKVLEEEITHLLNRKEEYQAKKEQVKRALQAKNVDVYDKMYQTSVVQYQTAKEKWEQIRRELDLLTPAFEEEKKQYEQLGEMEKTLLEQQMTQQKINSYLPIVEEIKSVSKQLKTATLGLDKIKGEQEALILVQKTNEERLQVSKQEWEKYENIEILIEQNKSSQERLLVQIANITELNQRYEALSQVLELKKQAIPGLNEAEQRYLTQKEQYDKKEVLYRRALIGIVARDLEDGKPCPVCGSTTHPVKATVEKEAPREQDLEEDKRQVEKLSREYQEVYSKIAAMNEKIELLQVEFDKKCKENSIKVEDLSNRLTQLQQDKVEIQNKAQEYAKNLKRKQDLTLQIQQLEEQKKEAENQSVQLSNRYNLTLQEMQQYAKQLEEKRATLPMEYQEVEKITLAIQKITNEIAQLKSRIEKIRTSYDEMKTRLERLGALRIEREDEMRNVHTRSKSEKEELANALAKYGFTSRDEYVQASMTEQDKELLEQEIQNYQETTKEKVAQRQTLQETIGTEPVIDVEKVRAEQEEIVLRKKQLLEEKQNNRTKQTVNEKAYLSMKEKLVKKEKLEQEYGVMKQLDNVTKGNNADRLVFEQYVLASYFEDILNAANLRLLTMTNSRYELMRSTQVNDARRKDSLDIEVLDHYTGKKRSVKSLSGGESFKAALSLALGMSDIIQNYAGGIEIDTLFIDEGFGSLDSESLEQALDTLSALTERNRLIGIISHVNELKERINNQIVVTRGQQGSTLSMKK